MNRLRMDETRVSIDLEPEVQGTGCGGDPFARRLSIASCTSSLLDDLGLSLEDLEAMRQGPSSEDGDKT